MMAAVAEQAEAIAPYEDWNASRVRRIDSDPAYTIAHNLCVAARELRLDALVIPTLSGRSARLVSAHRPTVPIYALSPGKETVRRCGLMWGVQAASMRRHETTEALIADAARRVVELGWCKPGQRVGITAGLPSGRPGTTSLVQIQTCRSLRSEVPRRPDDLRQATLRRASRDSRARSVSKTLRSDPQRPCLGGGELLVGQRAAGVQLRQLVDLLHRSGPPAARPGPLAAGAEALRGPARRPAFCSCHPGPALVHAHRVGATLPRRPRAAGDDVFRSA